MLQSCCEKIADFLIDQCELSEDRRPWYIYVLQTRISLILSIGSMVFLGCLIVTPCQVFFFLVGILCLRRRLGGFHAKTPLRCLFLSACVCILSLYVVKNIIKYRLSFFIWILFIGLFIAVFRTSPCNHPNCPLTSEELAASWIKAKKIYIWSFFTALFLQIFFAKSNCSLYCEMGIIAAAISFFVAKFKEGKSL